MAEFNYLLFCSMFIISGVSGVAAHLRTNSDDKPHSLLSYLTAGLNSGLLGLGIGLLFFVKFAEDLYFLVGICVVSGLGGMPMVEFAIETIKTGFLEQFGKSKKGKPHE